MKKFWFYFYGLPNVYGLGFSLIGLLFQLALLVSNNGLSIIFWVPICLGLYFLGWSMGWWVQDNDANLQFEQTLTAEEIEDELNKLIKEVKGRIPKAAFVRVQSIYDSIMSVLPHLVSGKFGNQDLHTVKQAVFDYLPTTLEHYLRLPTPYANYHVIQDGKTAKDKLIEQLGLLDDGLKDVTHSIYKNDAQELLANQRFLEARLGDHKSVL